MKSPQIDITSEAHDSLSIPVSSPGVALLEPIYAAEQLMDLRIVFLNEAGRNLLQSTSETSFRAYVPDPFFLNVCPQVIHTRQAVQQRLQIRPELCLQAALEMVGTQMLCTFWEVTDTIQRLQSILDASPNSIISMKALRQQPDTPELITDFLMENANATVERDLYLKPQDIMGKTLMSVFPGNKESGLFDMYARVAETGQPEHAIQYYRDSNGLEAWFEVSALAQGPDQITITFTNITQSQRNQQQLKQSNEALEQFASIASHDLQEPLRKIRHFGHLLATQYQANLGKGTELLDKMQSATDRMGSLINDLLTFAQLSNESTSFEAVDLNQILTEVCSDLEVPIRQQEALITIEPLPHLQANAWQMRQLFQNLLSNALKYVAPGVRPVIHIRSQGPQIYLRDRADSFYRIEVSDNGIGFNEEYQEKIFEAFQRLHSRSTYSGTGLGLTIVRNIVENHGGRILAHSQENQGSTFQIYLKA
ncbi:sensor histidine kinase [Siphonobacter sp.]|uniref:sensor histidine kinase n=1 Tax=Siphonobacter sp. TaxID=1869184 RepID=UPI003B3A2BEE